MNRQAITYYALILFTMVWAPIGCIFNDHFLRHSPDSLLFLTGKYFVFWGVGVRLGIAAVRQVTKPTYTAQTIFGSDDKATQHVVQELGFANLAIAILGFLSVVFPSWILPAAIGGATFYLLAGLKHAASKGRTSMQNWAMTSDLFVGLVLGVYAAMQLSTLV